MPKIETKIWLALKARINTLVTSPTLPRVEPGEVLPTPNNAPLLLISDARNNVIRVGIDPDLHIHSGTLILSVRWPTQVPVSHTQFVEIGGTIAAHFPADLSMQFGGKCIRVIEDATMLQPDIDGPWRIVTVRVLWSTM